MLDGQINLDSPARHAAVLTTRLKKSPFTFQKFPPEIRQEVYSLLDLKTFMKLKSTCKPIESDMLQGPAGRKHLTDLWPKATGIQDPGVCTAAIKKQYEILRNMEAGRCEGIIDYKNHDRVVKIEFAEQPDEQGLYLFFIALTDSLTISSVPISWVSDEHNEKCESYTFPRLQDYNEQIKDMTISADGNHVALACGGAGAALLELRKEQLGRIPSEATFSFFPRENLSDNISTISATRNFAHIVTGSNESSRVCVWARNNLEAPVRVLEGPSLASFGVRIAPSGQSIVVWQRDLHAVGGSTVSIWPDWQTEPKRRQKVEDPRYAITREIPHCAQVNDVRFSPNEQYIATTSKDCTVNIYDRWDKMQLIKKIDTCATPSDRYRTEDSFDAPVIEFAANNIFSATAHSRIGISRVSGPLQLQKFKEHPVKQRTLYSHGGQRPLLKHYTCAQLAFSSNSQYLAVSTNDDEGMVFVYNFATSALIH